MREDELKSFLPTLGTSALSTPTDQPTYLSESFSQLVCSSWKNIQSVVTRVVNDYPENNDDIQILMDQMEMLSSSSVITSSSLSTTTKGKYSLPKECDEEDVEEVSELLQDVWLQISLLVSKWKRSTFDCNKSADDDDNIDICEYTHRQRMILNPSLYYTESIRLLKSDFNFSPNNANSGIFQMSTMTKNLEQEDNHIFNRYCVPTVTHNSHNDDNNNHNRTGALGISQKSHGSQMRELLQMHGYTYANCVDKYLLPLLLHEEQENTMWKPYHAYDANAFFQNRQALLRRNNNNAKTNNKNPLYALVRLFLFGLGVSQSEMLEYFDSSMLHWFQHEAQLLTTIHKQKIFPQIQDVPENYNDNNINNNDIVWVGRVQIYPLDLNLFCHSPEERRNNYNNLYFMTDWPMESLLPKKYAIMSVGYDTLELVSLSLQDKLPAYKNYHRVLDLCCGCGIQGLAYYYKHSDHKHNIDINVNNHKIHLVSMDLNPRAIQFTIANMSLNFDDCHTSNMCAICGDLFHPHLSLSSTTIATATPGNSREGMSATNSIGKFTRILTNPPFVALPSISENMTETAMFGIGGGDDGMKITRDILSSCTNYLSTDTHDEDNKSTGSSILLMVTELCNIEEMTSLDKLKLNIDNNNHIEIKIAYCIQDVEAIDVYCQEREEEDGRESSQRVNICKEDNNGCNEVEKDWTWNLSKVHGIKNRALVLLSLTFHGNSSYRENHQNSSLSQSKVELFPLDRDNVIPPLDDENEDAFLTPMGVYFTRQALLPS